VHCDSVAVPGGRVNIYEAGGGPPVVLLHGLLGCPAYLVPLARALAAEGRHVLVPDLPGHGGSTPLRPFTFASAADHLAAAVREVTTEEPALFGHSLGAPIAVTWAARHPVRSLVAASPVGMVPLGLGRATQLMALAPALEAVARLTGPLLHSTRLGRRVTFGWFVGMCEPEAVTPELARRLVLSAAAVAGTAALPEILDHLIGFDLRPEAECVRCPSLVIWGEHDAQAGNGAELAAALRGRAEAMAGIGHMPMLEAPFTFRSALRGWL
jgi:pimeloyl-ACP methyl ester carboxylesterase